MLLEDGTAVVTGGARGIGRAYCELLGLAGANVVAVDLHGAAACARDLQGAGDSPGIEADVGEVDAVVETATTVLDRFGRCDIVVHNPAFMPMTSLDSVKSSLWRLVYAVQHQAPRVLCQGDCAGHGGGRMGQNLATGSAVTFHPQTCGLAYIASKAAARAGLRTPATSSVTAESLSTSSHPPW